MEVTYRCKDIVELAEHFEDVAKQLRTLTPKRKSERLHNEACAFTYEHVADLIRRTVLEKT